jgi:hypothetical protein
MKLTTEAYFRCKTQQDFVARSINLATSGVYMVPGSVAWLDLKDQYDKISYLHGSRECSLA